MAPFADEGVPPLTPVKTAADAASVAPSKATSTTTTQVSAADEEAVKPAVEDQEEEPATPTSEESKLRMSEVCPPAPRKPPVTLLPSMKRKSRPTPTPTTSTTTRVYLIAPRDLSALFRDMPMPPEKRIRAA